MVRRRTGVKKGGYKPKDAEIVDGFNTVKKGTPGIREIQKSLQEKVDGLFEKVAAKEKSVKNSKKSKKIVEKDTDDGIVESVSHDKASTYRMLADMRSVYKKVGGAKKLLKLIKGDDKLLITMVRELMKFETSLMATEIRAKDVNPGGGNQVTFVILKGLQDEDTVMGIKKDGAIDLEQVADAINPSAVPKIAYEEEMERPE